MMGQSKGFKLHCWGVGRREGGNFKIEAKQSIVIPYKNYIFFKCQFFLKLRSLPAEFFLNYCLLKPKFVYQHLVWV
jgi:hypothetical protein